MPTAAPSVEAISLAEQAYRAIRRMIISLELRPGAVIDERFLIERLRIGRTPIREALRQLAREHLVDVYPRRGMFVTTVEVRDLASLSEVRSVLESYACLLAAEHATVADRDDLAALAAKLTRRGPLDQLASMELDERIHRAIYRCAHNALLEQTLEEYYVLALRIWHLALDQAHGLDAMVRQHEPLLEAIRLGRGREASKLMRAHVDEFQLAMRQALLPPAPTVGVSRTSGGLTRVEA